MENQPKNNDEWEQKIESELSTDGILNAPLEGDDIVIFGRRLQDQIDKAPDELRTERAGRAKGRMDEHYGHHFGQLMFVRTNQAFVLRRQAGEQKQSGISVTNVNVSGELQGVYTMQIDGVLNVVFELTDATLHWIDEETSELKTLETSIEINGEKILSPTYLPLRFIHNHDLL